MLTMKILHHWCAKTFDMANSMMFVSSDSKQETLSCAFLQQHHKFQKLLMEKLVFPGHLEIVWVGDRWKYIFIFSLD